ncbi:MAG TPA: hypothetical protein PLW66_15835, partial [Saprospiraceae bacterium]|nr:hypothetical protein [Saprospiraceae bacterium]
MKAAGGNRRANKLLWQCFVWLFLLPAGATAQSALRRPADLLEPYNCPGAGFYFRRDWPAFCGSSAGQQAEFRQSLRSYRLLLPAWSADDLPFFCRIEHQWGRR